MVEVKLYADRLDIFDKKTLLASHQRRHTKFKWFLKLEHYLQTLQRKPGALKGAQALAQASKELKDIYTKYFNNHPKQFIELLHYRRAKKWSWRQIQQVISELLTLGCREITLDKIKIRLENKPKKNQPIASGQIEKLSQEQLKELANLFNIN